ncbi:hypothetical protein K1719_005250 [Acacia pycnantha]|nr:hypothetical protein K1719_005250 [Acacia pycnantha]
MIGFWAAWKFHNDKGIDNFYSVHSWLGLACLLLLPWHVFFGVYIYALAIAATTTGILEKATFLQTNKVISRYSSEAMLVNSLSILIIILGGLVILGIVAPSNEKANTS